MNERELFAFLKTKGAHAKKSLGQHFLINPNISKKIVEALQIQKSDKILEIGAGFASLSYFLAQNPAQLTLLDVDIDAIKFLKNLFIQQTNVDVIEGDVLLHDLKSYDLIVGNIPYYLTKHIIQHLLLSAYKTRRAILMLQKEASEKLFTQTNDKDFNPLAILISYLGEIKKVMHVSKNNFSPSPSVDSVIIQIDLTKKVKKEKLSEFYYFLNKLFLYKRKTIHNNLSKAIGNSKQSEDVLGCLQIDKNKRPHELSLDEYLLLFDNLNVKKS